MTEPTSNTTEPTLEDVVKSLSKEAEDHEHHLRRVKIHSDLILFLSRVSIETLKTTTTKELVYGWFVDLEERTMREFLAGDNALNNLKGEINEMD